MSMNNSGASGYLVKASDLIKALPESLHDEYNELIEAGDVNAIDNFLGNNLPESFPHFFEVFHFGGEMEADDLEKGVIYVVLDEDDLFVKTETKAMEAIKATGVIPEFQRWVTWG